jgi:hypothetical protein
MRGEAVERGVEGQGREGGAGRGGGGGGARGREARGAQGLRQERQAAARTASRIASACRPILRSAATATPSTCASSGSGTYWATWLRYMTIRSQLVLSTCCTSLPEGKRRG